MMSDVRKAAEAVLAVYAGWGKNVVVAVDGATLAMELLDPIQDLDDALRAALAAEPTPEPKPYQHDIDAAVGAERERVLQDTRRGAKCMGEASATCVQTGLPIGYPCMHLCESPGIATPAPPAAEWPGPRGQEVCWPAPPAADDWRTAADERVSREVERRELAAADEALRALDTPAAEKVEEPWYLSIERGLERLSQDDRERIIATLADHMRKHAKPPAADDTEGGDHG